MNASLLLTKIDKQTGTKYTYTYKQKIFQLLTKGNFFYKNFKLFNLVIKGKMFHNFYIVLLVNQRKKFMNFIMSYY